MTLARPNSATAWTLASALSPPHAYAPHARPLMLGSAHVPLHSASEMLAVGGAAKHVHSTKSGVA